MFNLQEICMECKDKERKHPQYDRAVKADHEAIARGDFNFKGIGFPR